MPNTTSNLNDLLKLNVSMQQGVIAPLCGIITIAEALSRIKNEFYKSQIDRLRGLINIGEYEKYNIHKKNLPAVTFCGVFNKRKKECINTYNYLIPLDIDKLSNDEMEAVSQNLKNDEFVLAFWQSPSNAGIKGIVPISFNFKVENDKIDYWHKQAFIKVSNYFLNKYKIVLDKSGSDTTRLCFFSSDKNLFLRDILQPFPILLKECSLHENNPEKEMSKKIKIPIKKNGNGLYISEGKNLPNDRQMIQKIIKYLTSRNFSITNDYESWFRVAYAISNTFTYDVGLKYYLRLCVLDGVKHDENKCINMLEYCYSVTEFKIKFATIIFLAKERGLQLKRGSTEGGASPTY